jgi:hypothetical protein
VDLRRLLALPIIFAVTGVVGCVENFEGARIEANISVLESATFKRADLVIPTRDVAPGDPAYFSHYELHATILGAGTVRLSSFLIQPAIHTRHPCLQYEPDVFCRVEEVEDSTPCPEYINMDRFVDYESIFFAVGVAETTQSGSEWVHDPGYDFMDRSRFTDSLFKDPEITDEASKLRRDNLEESAVRNFCSNLPAGYFLGNPYQSTRATSGEIFGAVDGPDPRTGSVVGGITLFTPANLEYMTELFLTRERDASRLNAENRNLNLPPGVDGQVMLLAQKHGSFGYIRFGELRGVMTVRMESPLGLPVTFRAAVYYDLDGDPIGF